MRAYYDSLSLSSSDRSFYDWPNQTNNVLGTRTSPPSPGVGPHSTPDSPTNHLATRTHWKSFETFSLFYMSLSSFPFISGFYHKRNFILLLNVYKFTTLLTLSFFNFLVLSFNITYYTQRHLSTLHPGYCVYLLIEVLILFYLSFVFYTLYSYVRPKIQTTVFSLP